MTQLLLVGVGHAHLEILRRFGRERPAGVDLEAVSLDRRHFYSGMIPGFLNGTYQEGELAVDVATLVERCGGRFYRGRAVRVDRGERRLELEDGRSLAYDLVSFNLGSGLVGADLPGVAEHALLLKPLSRAVAIRRQLAQQLATPDLPGTVVGGGAAGVELACSLAVDAEAPVRLVEASDRILAGYGDRFRARALAVLAGKRIEVRTGAAVAAVEPAAIVLESGERLPSRPPLWLAGARAPRLFRSSDLTTDRRGFLLIDDTLRHVADERIFAAGDCATLARHPETPKAGVYSVRQGPVLWRALLAALDDSKPPTYEPQSGFLSLLNTADGRALLRYRGLVSHSRAAWLLKDWIDRRFVSKYQRLYSD